MVVKLFISFQMHLIFINTEYFFNNPVTNRQFKQGLLGNICFWKIYKTEPCLWEELRCLNCSLVFGFHEWTKLTKNFVSKPYSSRVMDTNVNGTAGLHHQTYVASCSFPPKLVFLCLMVFVPNSVLAEI